MTPGEFSRPPVTVTADGVTALSGRDALPWALDTLDLGGDIRAKFIRLQDWVKILLGEQGKVKGDAVR